MKNKTIARIKKYRARDGFGRSKESPVGTTFRGTSYECGRRKYRVLAGKDWRVVAVTESTLTLKPVLNFMEPSTVIVELI